MKKILICLMFLLTFCVSGCDKEQTMQEKYPNTLRTAYSDYFEIGVGAMATDLNHFEEKQFNDFSTITAGYEMKWSTVQTSKTRYDWTAADKLAELCRTQDKKMRAHTIMWYRSTPTWIKREVNLLDTQEEKTSRLLEAMSNFYQVMFDRYSDIIIEVDVANELINDNSSSIYREDDFFYEIFLDDNGNFDQTGFEKFVADLYKEVKRISPDVKRYYNDYSVIVDPGKRANIITFIKNINKYGADVQGMGFQSHLRISDMNKNNIQKAIDDFKSIDGLRIAITELDISIYRYSPGNDELEKEYTDELAKELADAYDIIFSVARDNADIIDNVTLWGLTDRDHWLDTVSSSVGLRDDHPTMFYDDGSAKLAYYVVRDFKK